MVDKLRHVVCETKVTTDSISSGYFPLKKKALSKEECILLAIFSYLSLSKNGVINVPGLSNKQYMLHMGCSMFPMMSCFNEYVEVGVLVANEYTNVKEVRGATNLDLASSFENWVH